MGVEKMDETMRDVLKKKKKKKRSRKNEKEKIFFYIPLSYHCLPL
jgi:hypothetical protein